MAIKDVIDANIVPRNNANFITGQRLNTTLKAMVDDYDAKDTAEATARAGADIALQTAIAAETTARETADATMQGNINAEATARQNADTALSGEITAEVTARANADTALGGQITAEATARANADTALQGAITAEATARENADTAINAKIPTQATSENQLADKAFVNSSLNAIAAYYITSNASGDAFATKAALLAGPYYNQGELRTPTRNDYALVNADETHEGAAVRYVFDGTNWAYQYKVNDTPFTAAQLAAINSGATAEIIGSVAGKYVKPATGIPASDMAEAVQTSLGKADTALQSVPSTYRTASEQDVIDAGKVDKVTGMGLSHNDYSDAEKAKVTTAGTDIIALQGRMTTAEGDIDAIEGKIPSEASATNKLADKAYVDEKVGEFKGTTDATGEWVILGQWRRNVADIAEGGDYYNACGGILGLFYTQWVGIYKEDDVVHTYLKKDNTRIIDFTGDGYSQQGEMYGIHFRLRRQTIESLTNDYYSITLQALKVDIDNFDYEYWTQGDDIPSAIKGVPFFQAFINEEEDAELDKEEEWIANYGDKILVREIQGGMVVNKHYVFKERGWSSEYHEEMDAMVCDYVINGGTSKPSSEAFSVSSWSDLASADPFTKQATLTAQHTIGANTIVELINNNAVAFANYGFQIGAVSGQTITLYAIEAPTSAVNITINFTD